MAVGTPTSAVSTTAGSSARAAAETVVAYDRFIESRIRQTRRQVKQIDLVSSLMSLAAAVLAYLLLAAAADHWLFSRGLSVAERYLALALLVAGVAALVTLRLMPLILHRINPVFAAHAIESHGANSKNSLINFLLLRAGSGQLKGRVLEAVEVQAARTLAETPEAAVDRMPIIRVLIVLVAVTAATAIYAAMSPKSLLVSWRRIVEPWADVAAPTRAAIVDVQPGDATAWHERQIAVSAEIKRLHPGESVSLVYSTLDGQVVDRSMPMSVPADGYRYVAQLPPEKSGLQQDLEYWIEAGDAVSPHWRIEVMPAASLTIEEVEYHYPAYSGIPPRTVARSGDLKALAGTRVVLRAVANQPLAAAAVDFDCDGRDELPMKVDGRRATVEFYLRRKAGTNRAEHNNYQLRLHDQGGNQAPDAIRYTIEVIPDAAPEIEITEPAFDLRKEWLSPIDRPTRLVVRAVDPDFRLSTVRLHLRHEGIPLADEQLLATSLAGPFTGEYIFEPGRWNLQGDDRIEIWATADDDRMPEPNRTETPHYRLRITAPDVARLDPPEIAEQSAAQKHEKIAAVQGAAREADGARKQEQAAADRLDPERDAARAIAEIRQFFASGKEKPRGDKQRPSLSEGDERGQQPQQSEAMSRDHPARPWATESMSEGGPAAQNAEQSTAGRKQDGLEETRRQPAGNQGANNAAGASQQDNVGARSSGGTQKGRQQPDTSEQDDAGKPQPQAKFQRGMKAHKGGQSGQTEKPEHSGVDDRPGNKVEPHRGDHPMPGDLGEPSTSDASGERHQGENSHRRGGLSGADASRHQPQKQMPDGVSGKGEHRPKNEAAPDKPQEVRAKLGDDMPKNADGSKPPKPGQGENVFGSGDPNEKENATSQENFDDYKGGDPYTNDKGDAGAGEQGTNSQGSPPPIEQVSEVRDKKQISPDGKKPEHEDEPDAPAKQDQTKQSDSKSNSKGDRQGGGKSGGGQRAENQGTGAAGQNTAANQGGGQSDQQGGGPTGNKGGDRTKANQPTGGKPSGEQGSGSHRQAGKTRVGGVDHAPSSPAIDPNGHANDAPQQLRQNEPHEPQSPEPPAKRQPQHSEPPIVLRAPPRQPDAPRSPGKQNASSQPGQQLGGGGANPGSGGVPPPDGPDMPAPAGPADYSEPGGEAANDDYARRLTALTIERLKDQLAEDRLSPELLARLKWTRADVERFLAYWQRLERTVDETGARGDAARQELHEALRQLQLPSRPVSIEAGTKAQDRQRKLREGRRTSPPAEYAEQWYEFNKGLNTRRPPTSQDRP